MRARLLARWMAPVTIRGYRSALRSTALGLALICTLAIVVGASTRAASVNDEGLGADLLRTIRLDSFGSQEDPRQLTAARVAELADLPQVVSATPWALVQVVPVNVPADSELGEIVLALSTRIAGVQNRLAAGREPSAVNEVLLPASRAKDAGINIGEPLVIGYIRRGLDGNGAGQEELPLRVTGLYDDSVPGLDDPNSAYTTNDTLVSLLALSQGATEAWITRTYAFPSAYVRVDSLDAVTPTVIALRDDGFGATSVTTILRGTTGTANLLSALGWLLGLALIGVVSLTGWSMARSMVTARRGEVGVLRAIGWRSREIAVTFLLQMAAAGAVLGAASAGLAAVLVAGLAVLGPDLTVVGIRLRPQLTSTDLLWLGTTLLLPMIAFGLAGFLPVMRSAHTAPDEILRELPR